MFRRIGTAVGIVAAAGAVVGVGFGEWRAVAMGLVAMLAVALVSLVAIGTSVDRRADLSRVDPLERARDEGTKARADFVLEAKSLLDETLKRVDMVSRELAEVKERQEGLARKSVERMHFQTNEISSMFYLYDHTSPREPMPAFGRWSVGVQELAMLVSVQHRCQPELVVELGSGTSTVWMGYGLAGRSKTRIISIEHRPEQYEATAEAIERHGMSSVTEVRLLDLVSLDLGGETFPWYDPKQLDDIGPIDLLFVDGPPGGVRPMAKYPAIAVLGQRLAPGAIVVLREVEPVVRETIAKQWCERAVGLERQSSVCESMAVFRYSPSEEAGSSMGER